MADTIKKIIQVEVDASAAQRDSAALTATLAKLRKEQAELNKALKEAVALHGEQSDEAIAAGNALNQNKRRVAETAGEIRRLNKELDTNSNSLNAARQQLAKLNKEFDNLDQNAPNAAKEVSRLQKEISDLTDSIKEQEQATGRFQRNVGNYAGDIKKAFGESGLSGAIDAAKGGLMAIPQVAAAAFAFEAVQKFADWIDETNKRLQKTKAAVQQVSGATGLLLEEQTAYVQSIADATEQSFEDTLRAINGLKLLTGDFGTAAELVKNGMRDGANLSGEFLDILREYPSVLKDAGVSAKQLVAISRQAAIEGIYSDKAVGAIKEGALTLTRTLTPAAKQALQQIGLSGDELQKQIKSGSLTTFDALQQISKKLQGLNPQSKEFGDIVSEVFRGAGEDAQAFIPFLGRINTEFVNNTESAKQFDLAFSNLQKQNELMTRIADTTKGVGKALAEAKGFALDFGKTFLDVFEGRSLSGSLLDFFTGTDTGLGWEKQAEGAKKAGGASMDWGDSAEEAAAKAEAAILRANGITKEQIDAIVKQKAKQEELNALLAKYNLTLSDVTAAAQKDTKAKADNNAEMATGLSLLDEIAAKEYERIEAQNKLQTQIQQNIEAANQAYFENADAPDPVEESLKSEATLAYEHEQYLTQIKQEESAKRREIDAQEFAAKQEERIKDFENAQAISNAASSALEAAMNIQLAMAGDNAEKRKEIERRYAKAQIPIQIGQALISGILGGLKTVANVGMPAAIPFLLEQGLATAAAVSGIIAQGGKFADGGMVYGPSHARGGVKFAVGGRVMEMEGGEAILNKRSMANPALRAAASAINVAGGGKSFANGGMTSGATTTTLAGDPFAAAMSRMPVPVVRVQEINAVQNAVAIKVAETKL